MGSSNDRAYRALVEMFSVVSSGIAMSKVLLMIVLGSTAGAIFKEYYFRSYCLMFILGLIHSLIFLPVVLSLVGTDRGAICLPQPYKYSFVPPSQQKTKTIVASTSASTINP